MYIYIYIPGGKRGVAGEWTVGITGRLMWVGGARVVLWVDDVVDIDEELG